MGSCLSLGINHLHQYELSRLNATIDLFIHLERTSPTAPQNHLCKFLQDYTTYQKWERYAFHNPTYKHANRGRRLIIETLKHRYAKLMFALGFDIYRDPIGMEAHHIRFVYLRLACSKAVREECGRLVVRMGCVAGGAEDRDFELVEAAERLLGDGRVFLEDEERLVRKKTFVVDLFQSVDVPRIVVVDVDRGL